MTRRARDFLCAVELARFVDPFFVDEVFFDELFVAAECFAAEGFFLELFAGSAFPPTPTSAASTTTAHPRPAFRIHMLTLRI